MTPFIQRFPDLDTRETRRVTTAGLAGLPADEYALLELYCDELDCDCRRVVIEVIARSTGETMAIINTAGSTGNSTRESWGAMSTPGKWWLHPWTR